MFDIVIIGGGPGGYKTAELLSKRMKQVAIIEENAFGGVCLNYGCIPFKNYLHISKVRHETSKMLKAGMINGNSIELCQHSIVMNKRRIIKTLQQSIEKMLRSNGVEIIHGCADDVEKTVNGFLVHINEKKIECSKLVIATGSVEKKINIISTVPKIINSKKMLELETLPDSIDIIGGGAIGLEAASFFCDAGCKVSVVEAIDHVGGNIDIEIADALKRILENKGVSIYTNATFKSLNENSVTYYHRDGEIKSCPQYILVSVGRTPKLEKNMLSRLDILYDKRGIMINEECRTSNPNVYACGDVTGKLMLAHTAYRQAKVIADSICGRRVKIEYNIIPRIIYTNPEVLSVGYNEEECIAQGIEYMARSLPMTYSGKYFAENGRDGAKAKMIIDKDRIVIGFHMIGNGSSEFSLAAEMMISNKMSIEDVGNLVVAHPTYGEIVSDLVTTFL